MPRGTSPPSTKTLNANVNFRTAVPNYNGYSEHQRCLVHVGRKSCQPTSAASGAAAKVRAQALRSSSHRMGDMLLA